MNYADKHCKCIENIEPEHTYTYIGKWFYTKEEHSVTVKAEDLHKYRQGESIQKAFPYLSAKDREFLISGDWIEDGDSEKDEVNNCYIRNQILKFWEI